MQVEKIDELMKGGVIKPGRVGDDGKVHPVEHVLQLADDCAKGKQMPKEEDGEDSD